MKMVPLGTLAEINPPRPQKEIAQTQVVSFIPMAGVSEDGSITDEQERLYSQITEVSSYFTYFKEGDILLAKISPSLENGKAAFVTALNNQHGFGSTEFIILRPREGVDNRYLFYLVWNPAFRELAIRNLSGASGFQRISPSFVKEQIVPLPPLLEQIEIVILIEQILELQVKRRQTMALVEKLPSSWFFSIFGDSLSNPNRWPEVPLSSLVEITQGLIRGKRYQDTQMVKVSFLRAANISRYAINYNDVKEIEIPKSEAQQYEIKPGNILITSNENSIYSYPWREDKINYTYSNQIFKLDIKSDLDINAEYLAAWLQSETIRKHFLQTAGSIKLQKNLLTSLPILLPPIDLQRKYSTLMGQYGALHQAQEAALRHQQTLQDSLLRKVFCGQLNLSPKKRATDAN